MKAKFVAESLEDFKDPGHTLRNAMRIKTQRIRDRAQGAQEKREPIKELPNDPGHDLRNAVRKRAQQIKAAQEKGEPIRDLTKSHNPSFSGDNTLRNAMRIKTQRIRDKQ